MLTAMSTTLHYNFIGSHEEYEVLTVGFSDAQFNTQEYLWFQKSLDPEEDDEIYIEKDGQHQGTYGGVERVILSREESSLFLSEKTAQILNIEREIIISFSATDKQFAQFQSDLKRVFEGRQSLEIQ